LVNKNKRTNKQQEKKLYILAESGTGFDNIKLYIKGNIFQKYKVTNR